MNHLRPNALAAFVMAFSLVATAQETCSLDERIHTVRLMAHGVWDAPPVIVHGSGQHVEISFDDLQAMHERYTYRIEHCNADWTRSDLAQGEYMTGFNDTRIDDYEPAIGTEMDYCHYAFSLPNDENRLLVSGNYRVGIMRDGSDQPVAQACFSIVEPRVGIDIDVSGNTDIDSYATHQQVSFSINYSGYSVSNPPAELQPVVVQNHRWDTRVDGLRPTSMQLNRLIFNHQRSLIFDAGNEYRRFEILDEYVPTMHVDRMVYDDELYHAVLMADEQRTAYLFDRDQNGRCIVRDGDVSSLDDPEADHVCDYFLTHFTLGMPPIARGDVYLFGDLTGSRIDPRYRMHYNAIDHQYELVVPLKQGVYNYMYMACDPDEATPDGRPVVRTAPCEGNFHQTENEYWVYVYHRPFGERYDRLVGFQSK